MSAEKTRVFVAGATGTIGRAVTRELVSRGYSVVVLVRNTADRTPGDLKHSFEGADVEFGEVTRVDQLRNLVFDRRPVHAVVSCLASRNGLPSDAWAIDYAAHRTLLDEAIAYGVRHFVLLSAICVQKPRLEFQRAKLAFERELQDSGIRYSIVRPTAFFKSLSGQLNRVRAGKPYLMVADGEQTACKPISDADLAKFMANCLDQVSLQNRVLPIGGPGPALTPKVMGEMMFRLTGLEPRYKSVPRWFFAFLVATLSFGGLFSKKLRAKAELARIGRYYATESMLVWDADRNMYDPDETPSFGVDTLEGHYRDVLENGDPVSALGEHAVFS